MKRENISDAMDMLDGELLDAVAGMRGQKRTRRFSISKLVGMVAAAVLVISVTVLTAAATYRFDVEPQDEPRLLETARIYASQKARDSDGGMKELHFIKYCWDDYHYDVSFEGKLTGLRPVYNVKFKVAGYAYDIDIDTKTDVVTRCEKAIDTEWDSHFDDYEEFERQHNNWRIMVGEVEPEVEVGEMTPSMAYTIFLDYFDFKHTGEVGSMWATDKYRISSYDYSTDPMTITMSYYHNGYVYECRINSVTTEVTDASVTIATEEQMINPFTKEPDKFLSRHLHVHPEESEFISRYEANLIAIEELGFPKANDNYWDAYIDLCTDGKIYNTSTHKDEKMPKGVDAFYLYYVKPGPWINPDRSECGVNVFINARTGEVIKVEHSDNYRNRNTRIQQVPSADAPEGMISEADVQIIIIEELGLETSDDLYGFEIKLNDGVYEAITGTYDIGASYMREYTYKVDAVTGEILSKEELK